MFDLKKYQAFDAASALEASLEPPEDFEISKGRIRALIDMLPQRGVIEQQDIDRWVRRSYYNVISQLEAEHGEGNVSIGDVHTQIFWHVNRASGIGGSEIGQLVRHFRDDASGFTNARNIVMGKLLKLAPHAGTEETNRGHIAEPWIQAMYLTGQPDCISDEESLAKLKGFRWDKAPFIVGNPDDIILNLVTGKRRINDYKAPSAAVVKDYLSAYEKTGVANFDYDCQVTQYGIIARAAGVEFEDMAVVAHNPASYRLVEFGVQANPDLAREMMQAAGTIWLEYVMKGAIPEVPGPDPLDVEDERMKSLVYKAAELKIAADELERLRDEYLSQIQGIASDEHDLKVGKIDLGFASFTRTRTWDEDQLVEIAKTSAVEVSDFYEQTKKVDGDEAARMLNVLFETLENAPQELHRIVGELRDAGIPYGSKLDAGKLAAALEAEGVSTLPAASVGKKFLISTAKKQAEVVGQLKLKGIEIANAVDDAIDRGATEAFASFEAAELEYDNSDRSFDMADY